MASYRKLYDLVRGLRPGCSEDAWYEEVMPYLLNVWLSDYARYASTAAVREATRRARSAPSAVTRETAIAHALVKSLYDDGRLDEQQVAAFADACAACRGHCCRNGGNDAYLDENAIRQAWARHPRLSARGLMRLYLDAIPDKAFADSCLFHAKDGCSLPRSLRAPISEAYLCGPLMRVMKG